MHSDLNDHLDIEDRVRVEISVLVLDLFNAEALCLAAEMSLEISEVAQGIALAQEANMHLLMIAMRRCDGVVVCTPVVDINRLGQALHAMSEAIGAAENTVSWSMVPPSLGEKVTPLLQDLERQWATRTQGLIY